MLKYALIEVVNNASERDLTNVVYDETFLLQKKLLKNGKISWHLISILKTKYFFFISHTYS